MVGGKLVYLWHRFFPLGIGSGLKLHCGFVFFRAPLTRLSSQHRAQFQQTVPPGQTAAIALASYTEKAQASPLWRWMFNPSQTRLRAKEK